MRALTRSLVLATLLALFTSALLTAGAAAQGYSSSREYRSEKFGVAIDLPAQWKAQEEGDVITFQPESAPCNFTVGIFSGLSAEEYRALERESVEKLAAMLAEEYRKARAGFALVRDECGKATVAGREAYRMVWTEQMKDGDTAVELKIMQIVTMHDGRIFFLQLMAGREYYAEALPTAEAMVRSFRFL